MDRYDIICSIFKNGELVMSYPAVTGLSLDDAVSLCPESEQVEGCYFQFEVKKASPQII